MTLLRPHRQTSCAVYIWDLRGAQTSSDLSRIRSAVLTREGESARPPTEAFSSSIDGGTHLALSDTRGLILILNFFLLSSSSSESLEEKKCLSLEAGGRVSRAKWEMHAVQRTETNLTESNS